MGQNDINRITQQVLSLLLSFFLFYLNRAYIHTYTHTRTYAYKTCYRILYVHFMIKCKYRKRYCYVCNLILDEFKSRINA